MNNLSAVDYSEEKLSQANHLLKAHRKHNNQKWHNQELHDRNYNVTEIPHSKSLATGREMDSSH